MERPRKRARIERPSASSPTPKIEAQIKPVFEQVSTLSSKFRLNEMADSEVYYVPDFINDSKKAGEWYDSLLGLDSWYQPKLKMYGREITQSRKIAAYATDPNLTLKYSGQTVDMRYQYPTVLRQIQDEVEEMLGVKFNHVMLNLYEDGTVYIGNHRDNLENKVIASLSLGAPRTFIMTRDLRKKGDKNRKSLKSANNLRQGSSPQNALDEVPSVTRKSWILQSGSLVVMQGETQKHWKHEIPKEPKVKEGRISLTFRQLVT
ncbi:hypothetical protein M413DRAFT_448620 [Hebeloma cylindrosporum]|uniref:Fe2OG dioxygenase domain-containing protein n=1 Tax=Hebeloma cylindrosporum TaxID=76867 RepID=A0A0C3BZ65_HEBCY|nr:hypothetical protein M413DRAFT_448620 [Hebeloma cylindrosporum h7]